MTELKPVDKMENVQKDRGYILYISVINIFIQTEMELFIQNVIKMSVVLFYRLHILNSNCDVLNRNLSINMLL